MRVANNTVAALLDLYRSELHDRYGSSEARAIARAVFQGSFGWDVLQLDDHKEDALGESELLKVYEPLQRLRSGEPLQYVLGYAWFMGMKLHVGPGVLIPRPETEELVDHIAKLDRAFSRIVDIGTGSGCIAISMKRIFPSAHVTGMDLSKDALRMAEMNGVEFGSGVEWLHADVLAPGADLPTDCDLVVSNPPYVPRSEADGLAQHVRAHEPSMALFVEDADPLLFYRVIGEKAMKALVHDGELWFEGHYLYTSEAASMLQRMGYREVLVMNDMSGSPRFIRAVR